MLSLTQIDPIKSGSLSPAINLTLRYPEGMDGVGIVKHFAPFVFANETNKIESNLKTLITNRFDKIKKELKLSEAAYDAEISFSIASPLENTQSKNRCFRMN